MLELCKKSLKYRSDFLSFPFLAIVLSILLFTAANYTFGFLNFFYV